MFESLHVFMKVYECRNFTKASELLFISQPTISLKIKQLEQQLGVSLFVRKGVKSVQPTAQATYFYEQALAITDLWNKTLFTLHHADLEETVCTITCSNTFGYYYFPDLLPALIATFPKVHFTLNIVNTEGAVQSIYRHEAHFAFVEKPIETTGLAKKVLFHDELVLAGNADSPHWLMREKQSGSRFFNELYLAETNQTFQMIQVNNIEMQRQLLLRGVGQAIVPRCSVEQTAISYTTLSEKYNREMFMVSQHLDASQHLQKVAGWLEHYFKNK